MITVPRVDLGGDRWVQFDRSLPLIGTNLTGAAFLMHVRTVADGTGAALVTLATVASATLQGVRLVYGGTDTVANHITAGRLPGVPDGYTSASSIILSVIGIRIDETTMEGLPFPTERGSDVTLAWDLHITPSGGTKDKYVGGLFVVRAGATQ